MTTIYNVPTASTLSTENWIALLAILGVLFTAIAMTFRRLYLEKARQYAELASAYHSQENEVNQRTQRLRASNNELHDEIAHHQLTEAKLRQTQNYLYSIIDSMPSILIGVTSDGKITHWNSRAEELTGYDEQSVIGKYLQDIWINTPASPHLIKAAIQQKQPKNLEQVKLTDKYATHYYDVRIYPLTSDGKNDKTADEAVVQIDDVTLRVMMERQVIQSEKMASLGELAAGMAHEINNPLGAILQGLQNIERRTSPSLPKNRHVAEQLGGDIEIIETYLREREIFKFLDGIRDAGERSARIVSNMLDFSHQSGQHVPIDLNELARHCLELADNSFEYQSNDMPHRIQVITSFDPSLPHVACCPAEIQQVILNLLRNASHSFVDENGQLTIYSGSTPTIRIETLQHTGFAILKIIDNGCGITDENRRQIFQPFFTTKQAGHGTGLGLSISYFIMTRHHQGRIEVESTAGQGSTFTISLPTHQTIS